MYMYRNSTLQKGKNRDYVKLLHINICEHIITYRDQSIKF